MSTTGDYLAGLKAAYLDRGGQDIWQEFDKVRRPASEADLAALVSAYPAIPAGLLEMLSFTDGTEMIRSDERILSYYLLGSDVDEYPYYLCSARAMEGNEVTRDRWLGDYVERKYPEDVMVDERIGTDAASMNWLRFSNCMNGGGTSMLFLDFSPAGGGTVGQVVRFLHDPDSLTVLAPTFDDYLTMLIDHDYDFINEDTISSGDDQW